MIEIRLHALGAILSLFLVTACSTQVDDYKVDSESFRALAIQAENRGDYLSAHLGYERVLSNTRLANLGPKAEARNLFHIARIAGYRGLFRKCVYQFRQTLELIEKASPDPDIEYLKSKTYVELARLYHDTDHHDSAIPYFHQAVNEIEKQDRLNQLPMSFQDFLAHFLDNLKEDNISNTYLHRFEEEAAQFQPEPSDSFDPLLFAEFLDERSHALEAMDDSAFALAISAEAQHIREQQTLANDPIAFATFLDDFAESLIADEESEYAAYVANKAQSIREAHPGESAKEKAVRY